MGQENKQELMKVVFVGHVDHGKSTLIGRLLYDSGALPPEKLQQVQRIAQKQGKEIEYAYVLDALEEEQGQNVTIDMTQVWFASTERNYVIIDAPGHKEFLKNMISGAAAADAAVLLVDAKEGIKEQTKRHSNLLSLLGIKSIIVVVNKMDLVDYHEKRFRDLKEELSVILDKLNLEPIAFIPTSAKRGENIIKPSNNLNWYQGQTFLQTLDQVSLTNKEEQETLRLPIQDVYKYDDRRVLAGTMQSGLIKKGDSVVFSPSNKKSRVKEVIKWNEQVQQAHAGDSIGITLEDPLFIERGEVCSLEQNLPLISDKIQATIFWMDKKPLSPHQELTLKLVTQEMPVSLIEIEQVLDSETLDFSKHKESIEQNDVAMVTLQCRRPITFDPVSKLLQTGRFVLIDQHQISGGGIIREGKYPDRRDFFSGQVRSTNIKWEKNIISQEDRELLNKHKGAIIWLTGLSGSGKSTIAKQLEVELFRKGVRTFILDGDNVRHGLCADLAFSPEERMENIRRIGEVAKLFCEAGVIVIIAFISPYKHDRQKVRNIAEGRFIEAHVACPLEVCKQRDTKGLYGKAMRGEIKDFTGISAPYEEPQQPELRIDTSTFSVEESVEQILNYLKNHGFIQDQ